MPAVIFTMLIVLGVAAGIIAVVVMGIEGTGRSRHPEIADAMARTARHLNGEGRPPKGLTQLFDEIDDVSASDFHPRQIPGRLKSSIASVRSAVSARSATSARSAASAPELDLITVPPATTGSASEASEPHAADAAAELDGLAAAATAAVDGEAPNPWAPPQTQSDAGSDEVAEVTTADEIDQANETDSVAEVSASDEVDDATAPDEVAGVPASDELKADLARALEAPASEVVFDDPYGVTGASASEDLPDVAEATAYDDDFEDPYGVLGTSHHEIVPTDDPDPVSDDTIVHGKLPLS